MKSYQVTGKLRRFDHVENKGYHENKSYRIDANNKLEARDLFIDYIADLEDITFNSAMSGLTQIKVKAIK
jgi:hypothetical protein